MAEPQRTRVQGFAVPSDQVLIGLVLDNNGHEMTYYFADDAAADAATDGATEAALQLIGAWSDLDWEETQATLDRIRHESPPSPPLEV